MAKRYSVRGEVTRFGIWDNIARRWHRAPWTFNKNAVQFDVNGLNKSDNKDEQISMEFSTNGKETDATAENRLDDFSRPKRSTLK